MGFGDVVTAVKVERIPQDVITSIFVVSHGFVLLLLLFIGAADTGGTLV